MKLFMAAPASFLSFASSEQVAAAAGATASGIEDALRDYGITIREIPITPARLAELIRASSAARK